MTMMMMMMDAFRHISDRVGGGEDDDIVMQTPEQYLQKSRFTRYLQYFRDVGQSYTVTRPTSGLCDLDLGISDGFLRKLGFSGMMTTLFRGHPEQYLHTLARTQHTLLQQQTLLRRGLGFRGVEAPSTYSWHLCLDVALQVFGVLQPSWQHLRSARYLQHFRTIRPPAV